MMVRNGGLEMKGTRLSEDWEPSEADIKFARDLEIDPDWEAAKFKSYWLAKSGKDATKIRWDQTWQNWIRNAAERVPSFKTRKPQQTNGSTFTPACKALPAVAQEDRDLWKKAAAHLVAELKVPTYKSWIEPLTLEYVTETHVGFIAPSRFIRDHVYWKFENAFEHAWRRTFSIRFAELERTTP